jgi:hypothetical protein
MSKGGGFILAPAKPLQPETPTENAVAVVDAYSGQIGHPFRFWPDTDSGDIGHLSERSDAGCLNLYHNRSEVSQGLGVF